MMYQDLLPVLSCMTVDFGLELLASEREYLGVVEETGFTTVKLTLEQIDAILHAEIDSAVVSIKEIQFPGEEKLGCVSGCAEVEPDVMTLANRALARHPHAILI